MNSRYLEASPPVNESPTLIERLRQRWWFRALLSLGVIVFWVALTNFLGELGSFPRAHDEGLFEASVWAVSGAGGVGLIAAIMLVRTRSGEPLIPSRALIIPALVSAALYTLVVVVAADGQGLHNLLGPVPELWPPFLVGPTTLAVVAAIVLNRYVPVLRVVSACAAIAFAVLPWPLLLVLLVERGCC